MMKIMRYDDLLRLGYEKGQLDPASGDLCCAGAVRVMLERYGFPPEMLPVLSSEVLAAIVGAAACAARHGARWEFLGAGADAAKYIERPCDVLLAEPPHGLHVSILVKPGNHPRMLSSAKDVGVYTTPPELVQCVRSAWRPIMVK